MLFLLRKNSPGLLKIRLYMLENDTYVVYNKNDTRVIFLSKEFAGALAVQKARGSTFL